jgi:glycosyltransferase involved in cell wall biosynthesis
VQTVSRIPDLPLITVIVTYYNEGPLLLNALATIAAQTYAGPIEVIIVDDSSTVPIPPVESIKIPVRIFRTSKNLYAGGARNFGAHKASGKYLMFLDSDDEYCPDKIQTHINFLLEHPGVAFVGSPHWDKVDGQINFHMPPALANYAPEIAKKTGVLPPEFRFWVCGDYCFNTGAMTFPSEAFFQLHGFDEKLRWGEEWELQARAAQIGRVGFIASPSYYYVSRPNTITSTVNPRKYKSYASIFRNYRRLVPDLPKNILRQIRAGEHRAWLLACQLYLEHSSDPKNALLSALNSFLCGCSLWSVRSFIRSIFWLLGGHIGKKQAVSN